VIRTQVQIPETLFAQAKGIARRQEISLSEVVRRGLEYMVFVCGPRENGPVERWSLPDPIHAGKNDPFLDPDWRIGLHTRGSRVAESRASYGGAKRKGV
jgi:hypothetical protein